MWKLRKEWPLLLGISLGIYRLWRYGGLGVFDAQISGYSWPNYLRQGWVVQHRQWREYDYFREPLYAGTLGFLGEQIQSYPQAALLLSFVAGIVIVISSGLCVRLLTGPWAGGLAALSVASVDFVAKSVRWGNHYPFSGASIGLSLLGLIWCLRKPSTKSAITAAVLMALSCSIDSRGWMILPLYVGVMLYLGFKRHRYLVVFVMIVTMQAPAFVRTAFESDVKHELSWEQIKGFQQQVISRWIRLEPQLRQSCQGVKQTELLQPAFFHTPCSEAISSFNRQYRLPPFLPFSLAWTLIAVGIIAIKKNKLPAFIVGCSGSSLVLLTGSTPLPTRYLIQYAVPLAMIVPMGLFYLLPSQTRSLRIIVFGSLFTLQFMRQPSETARNYNREQSGYIWMLHHLRNWIPQGQPFMDCGEFGLSSALLPHHRYPFPLFHQRQNKQICQLWINADTERWMAIQNTDPLISTLQLTTGWSLYFEQDRLQVWRFQFSTGVK